MVTSMQLNKSRDNSVMHKVVNSNYSVQAIGIVEAWRPVS